MRAQHLGQSLTVTVVLTMMLLITSSIGLGAAIWNGFVLPPTGELRYGAIHILAYTTHYLDCPPMTQCAPESVAPAQAYFVVWSIHERSTIHPPCGRTARRLLATPVKR
jgi:hypothetical protein